MSTFYRVSNKLTGNPVADVIVEGDNVTLLSSTHELSRAEDMVEDLDDLKKLYIQDINAKAASVRARYLTIDAGQAFTYAEKKAEAIAFFRDASPNPGDYPYLAEESTATGMTPNQVATAVKDKFIAYKNINKIIEAQRRRGIVQVNAALNEVDAKTVRDFAITSLQSHSGE